MGLSQAVFRARHSNLSRIGLMRSRTAIQQIRQSMHGSWTAMPGCTSDKSHADDAIRDRTSTGRGFQMWLRPSRFALAAGGPSETRLSIRCIGAERWTERLAHEAVKQHSARHSRVKVDGSLMRRLMSNGLNVAERLCHVSSLPAVVLIPSCEAACERDCRCSNGGRHSASGARCDPQQ